MSKLLAFLDLFRKGSAVSDPAVWKNRSALTLALTALILTGCRTAREFGYDIPISETDAATIAAGVAVVVGLLSTYITSEKVGILPPKPVQPEGDYQDTRFAELDPSPVDRHEQLYPRDTGGGG